MMPHHNRTSTRLFTIATLACFSYATAQEPVRFATFNVAMNRPKAGALADELESGTSEQAIRLAEIIQRVRPDVLLLNEVDYDEAHRSITAFRDQYLAKEQGGQKVIAYPYMFTATVNTGVPSARDLDHDGKLDEPEDCLGYGTFPGQYGMVVLSQHPIQRDQIRTFQNFLWQDMPDALLPQLDGNPYYNEGDLAVLPLSSKSHWDVPIQCPFGVVHFLVSHPTPPVFDGAEDRNGTRNHDEIRFFADYIDTQRSTYIVDDKGQRNGLAHGAHFVIAGDLNADPNDGQSTANAAELLTKHPLIRATPVPTSTGGVLAAKDQAGANESHQGDPAQDTGDFNDKSVGNLRIDYVLPSKTLAIKDSGVFWPAPGEPGANLPAASDHRLVWIDITTNP